MTASNYNQQGDVCCRGYDHERRLDLAGGPNLRALPAALSTAVAQGERGGDREGEREGFLGLGDLLGERERPRPPAERGGDLDLAGDLERLRPRLGLRAGDLQGADRRVK
ncbi:hypothetical protein N2152v2_008968 [Parachlorella kessleri]